MNALEIAQARAAQAARNREAMPIIGAFVDELRKIFPQARVTYASEAGRIAGSRGDEGVRISEIPVRRVQRKTGARRA